MISPSVYSYVLLKEKYREILVPTSDEDIPLVNDYPPAPSVNPNSTVTFLVDPSFANTNIRTTRPISLSRTADTRS